MEIGVKEVIVLRVAAMRRYPPGCVNGCADSINPVAGQNRGQYVFGRNEVEDVVDRVLDERFSRNRDLQSCDAGKLGIAFRDISPRDVLSKVTANAVTGESPICGQTVSPARRNMQRKHCWEVSTSCATPGELPLQQGKK